MKAVIYARHSSEKQNPLSTQDQIKLCKNFCKDRDFEILEVFYDEEISGKVAGNRHGFLEMEQFIKRTPIDVIISEDLSRISRSRTGISSFWDLLQFMDINIYSVNEGLITDLHIGMKGTMNELYIKDLRDKTKRGQKAAIEKGKILAGNVYGYDIVRKLDEKGELIRGVREINKDQAKVIRKIFKFYLEGHTFKEICDFLNNRDIPSPNGKKWIPSILCGTRERKTGILRQTLYDGVSTHNKMEYKTHPVTGKRTSTVRPESEWTRQPVEKMRIVDHKTFAHVQKELDTRSSVSTPRKVIRASPKPEEETFEIKRARPLTNYQIVPASKRKFRRFLHSRKLFCKIHPTSRISPHRLDFYSCREKACTNKGYTFEQLEQAILDALLRFKTSSLKQTTGYISAITVQKKLNQKIRKLEKELERLYLVYAKDQTIILENMIKQRKADLQQLTNLRSKYEIIAPTNFGKLQAHIRAYKSRIEELARSYKENPDNDFVYQEIRRLFDKALVSPPVLENEEVYITLCYDFKELLSLRPDLDGAH